jgi:hypothetical protein
MIFAIIVLASTLRAADPPPPSGQIISIENKGMLFPECTLPGETRADDVAPGQAVCAQAARNRWILIYQTRSWRGVDDERSIIYQIRKDAPDGPMLKEGFISRSINDWDPLHDGSKVIRQHGHPVICGVPQGALIDGKPARNANLFVIRWRVVGINYDPVKKQLIRDKGVLMAKTQGVEWAQVRLNDEENDLVIVQPSQPFRQKGFETGPAICSAQIGWMNQAFVPPVPFNRDCTQWANVDHFDEGRIAAIKLTFNPGKGLYEWTETGPLTGNKKEALSEASLARAGDRWVVAARSGGHVEGGPPAHFSGGISWAQTADPFKEMPTPLSQPQPATNAPITAFTCADGVLRTFTGDLNASPYHYGRNPLYGWDVTVKPDGFSFTNRQEIFDTFKAGLKFRKAVSPRIDFALLFPPHGKTQILNYRVAPRAYNFPYANRNGIPALKADEKPFCGIYYSVITYREVQAEPWTFAEGN